MFVLLPAAYEHPAQLIIFQTVFADDSLGMMMLSFNDSRPEYQGELDHIYSLQITHFSHSFSF